MNKSQRLDRLVDAFLDKSLEPGEELETITGFMPFVTMREIHSALEVGTKTSCAHASRLVADYCRRLLVRIVSDPFDRNAGRFLDEAGALDLAIDPNVTNFALIRLLAWYFNWFEKLSPAASKLLLKAIQTYAAAQAHRKTHFGYTNIMLMECANRILAGEVLQDREMSAEGFKRLQGWLEFTALASGPSEYNSPTYTGVSLHVIGAILQWTNDKRTRLMASLVQERLWMHVANYYHSPTAQMSGPNSRSYHLDITFNPSLVKSALYAEIGDERLMGPNHTLHDSDWSAYRFRFFLPDYLRPLFCEREMPFQSGETVSVSAGNHKDPVSIHGAKEIVVLQSQNRFSIPGRPSISLEELSVRSDLICFQTENYTLGTASHWFSSVQRNPLYAAWRHESNDEWDFFRCLFDRLLINGERPDWFWPGRFSACQEGGTAIVVHQMPRSPRIEAQRIREIKVSLVLPHLSQFDSITVMYPDRAFVPDLHSDRPVEIEADGWLFLRDGETFIAIRPFEPIGYRDKSKVQLVSKGKAGGFNPRIENQEPGHPDAHFLSLDMQLYRGRARKFSIDELRPLHCGYVLEMSSQKESGSFKKFQKAVIQSRLKVNVRNEKLIVGYGRKGSALLHLTLHMDDWDHPIIRQVNGKSITGRRLDTPFAVQSSEKVLKVAGCTLKKSRVPVWLIADNERRHYVATNPCREATPIVINTPHGTIRCDSLPTGRLICKLGQQPSIRSETFEEPGRITLDGAAYTQISQPNSPGKEK